MLLNSKDPKVEIESKPIIQSERLVDGKTVEVKEVGKYISIKKNE